MNITITGLITLSEAILCGKDVLGKSFQTMVSGIEVAISFPRCPEFDWKDPQVGMNNPLLFPENRRKWRSSIEWGYPIQYPSCNSVVKNIAISAICDRDHAESVAEQIYSSIEKWEHAFIDYLILKTKQLAGRNKNVHRDTCMLELMAEEYIPYKNQITHIYVSIPQKTEFASESIILDALSFAGSEKELRLEYQMLLSAYEARRNNNRLTIINACSAMELCLYGFISKRCQELNYDSDLFLQKKFRSLGDRIKLAKNFDPYFPEIDYNTRVVIPRNYLVHNRDIYPTDETTDDIIACVEECLDYFYQGKYCEE